MITSNRESANNLVRPSELLENHDLWGAMKLQANAVRTVIMQALMHTRGTLAHPWRQDLQLGAAEDGDTLTLVVRADKAWDGLLEFDIPRHKVYMGFQQDWPRMNTLPEWFTVELDKRYKVTANNAPLGTYTGGSVRVPASMTGLAGLKVTARRWSVDGAVPLSSLFDSAGLICRRVADLAWGFSGLDGMQRSQTSQSAAINAADLSKLRIGVGGPELWDECAPGIAETVSEALD